MSDFPTPCINDEYETFNNPTKLEEKQNDNNKNNNYDNYPENIETIKDDNNNNINPKTKFSEPIIYKSKFSWPYIIFIILFSSIGIGTCCVLIKVGNIGLGIGFNIITLFGIAFSFCLKCKTMIIDLDLGVIYIKECKIYYCKRQTYNINDIVEINIKRTTSTFAKSRGEIIYDLILILNDGRNIVAASRSNKDSDSTKVYNHLLQIFPKNIKFVDYLNNRRSNPKDF